MEFIKFNVVKSTDNEKEIEKLKGKGFVEFVKAGKKEKISTKSSKTDK